MSNWSAFRIVTIDGKRIRVDMKFDLDKLARQLGYKAMRNKSRKSKLAVGVTAEARETNGTTS